MSRITLRPSTDADCVGLADTMRADDRAEIALSGHTPLEALRLSLAESSHSVTAADEAGRVICMFGVGPVDMISEVGCPWLLGSDLVETHWRLFLRLSRKYLASIRDLYPILSNVVDARSAASIRWLRWLGFNVGATTDNGVRVFSMGYPLIVADCKVDDIEAAPNMPALLEEYAEDGAIEGRPVAAPRWEVYRSLEAAGMLHAVAATIGDDLVGFVTVLATPLSRYAAPIATSESFFVAKAHRKSGAGLRLLRAALKKAADVGASGLLVGAPSGGPLAEVLPRVGFVETTRVFFKAVGHD